MTEREFQDALYARLRWDLRHDFIIPNYTPPGLVAVEEVPEFAGLLVLHNDARSRYLETVKPAPKLHGKKISDTTIAHIGRVYAYRYWNIRLANKAVQESPDPLDAGV